MIQIAGGDGQIGRLDAVGEFESLGGWNDIGRVLSGVFPACCVPCAVVDVGSEWIV